MQHIIQETVLLNDADALNLSKLAPTSAAVMIVVRTQTQKFLLLKRNKRNQQEIKEQLKNKAGKTFYFIYVVFTYFHGPLTFLPIKCYLPVK